MSSLSQIFKKSGLKKKDLVCFAEKLTQECDIEKIKEIYETMKKSQDTARKCMKKLLHMMENVFGEDTTMEIVKQKLESFQVEKRPKELARTEKTSAAAVSKVFESETDAQLQSVQNVQGALQPTPLQHINIVAESNAVVNAPIITGNNVLDAINAGMNVDTNKPTVLPNATSNCVPDNANTCFGADIETIKKNIKSRIKENRVFEGTTTKTVDLDELYTEIYIVDSDFSHAYNKHEIWQVEVAHMLPASEGKVIRYHEIFKPGVGGRKVIKSVLTKGIAGIGKTITVKKYIRDWAEERNKDDIDFDFIFLLPFRDLNIYKDGNQSLLEILHSFYPELKEAGDADINKIIQGKILLIFDGLDESQFSLNVTCNFMPDVTTTNSLDVLLTSLMRGKLLPKAHLWITTRPAAADQLPEEILTQGYISQIQGFNDQQKEESLRKHIKDEEKAAKIISQLKSSRSLYIMCHVPLFCWMSATVLMSGGHHIPRSLTEMYIHFLITQTGFSHKKYTGSSQLQQDEPFEQHKDIILKLGEMAFQHLDSQQIYFKEKDLKKIGIDDIDYALKYPGFCAELLKMEYGHHCAKYYCFVHLSLQEFLAALYAFHEFADGNHDALKYFKLKTGNNLTDFLNAVVDKAITSKNGHLDLFTRFLCGISLDSSKELLDDFLPCQGSSKEYQKKVVQHIKALRKRDLCPSRCINLIHCLVELNDKTFPEKLKNHQGETPLSPFLCSALAHQLVTSDEGLVELDMKKYRITEDCYYRLTPAFQFYKRLLFNCTGITKTFCPTLAVAICVPNAILTELDLSHNNLQSGLTDLSQGLCDPNCKVEKLNLSHNGLNHKDVLAVCKVLKTSHSKLKELDLSNNDFCHQDMDILCAALRFSHLHVLRLSGCRITNDSCCSLASALKSNQCHLEELDLSYNHTGGPGERQLLELIDNTSCALKNVKMHEAGECRDKPWLHKYDVELKLDPNTANTYLLLLSVGNKEMKKVKRQTQQEPYPNHPDRFDRCNQVLCSEGLTGHHYWEVEKTGPEVHVGVAYKSISRKGAGVTVHLGQNSVSWIFIWSDKGSMVSHNNNTRPISVPCSNKMGIFLDQPAGTLSFYKILESEEPLHLYTFHTTFEEPVYPAFRIHNPGTELILSDCQ